MLKHYNIEAVMTDSPAKENLEFLSASFVSAFESYGKNQELLDSTGSE